MTGTLKYIFNASKSQTTSKSIIEQMKVNTYDVVKMKATAGVKKVVSFLPNSTARLKFFCIKSDLYYGERSLDSCTAKMEYKMNVNTQASEIPIILNRSQILIGKSMFYKLGNFSKLKIKNVSESADVNIRILVGRDV
jgi:hypothetical protein